MRHYSILPTVQIKNASLSKDALKRLVWLDWYFFNGRNAELTCRHFGISKSLFYRWKNRFNPNNLQTLEFDTKTRRPRDVRKTTMSFAVQKRIYDIRLQDPEKSKYEIQEELRREGIFSGQSAIQNFINRHKELLNTQHHKRIKKHRGTTRLPELRLQLSLERKI